MDQRRRQRQTLSAQPAEDRRRRGIIHNAARKHRPGAEAAARPLSVSAGRTSNDGGGPEIVNEPMNQILDLPLWLGHAGDGRDYRRLLDAGIQAIVQLAAEEPALSPPREL